MKLHGCTQNNLAIKGQSNFTPKEENENSSLTPLMS